MSAPPYTKPGRLSDVLALIQVLSLDEYTHRSESGVIDELQNAPLSSISWIELAKEHPEFFRVRSDNKNLSLVARHVMVRNVGDKKPPLPSDVMNTLFQTAVDLHDRQVKAAERWKDLIPLLVVLLSGIVGVASTLLTAWLTGAFKRS